MSFKRFSFYSNQKIRKTLYSKGGSIDGPVTISGNSNLNGDFILNGNNLSQNNQKYISLLKNNTNVDRKTFPYIDVAGLAGKDQNGNDIVNNKWFGGTIALDGNLYCAPYNANRILKINTEYNNASSLEITSSYTGDKNQTGKWAGAACSFNNKVYFAPFNAEQILVLDVDSNTTYTLDYQKSKRTDASGGVTLDPEVWSSQYKGACVDLSENIIFMPVAAMQMMKLNPRDDSISYYGLEDFSNNCTIFNTSNNELLYYSPASSGGALVSNGNIYLGYRGNNGSIFKNMFLSYTDTVNETVNFIDLSNALINGVPNVSGNFRSEICEGIVTDTTGRYVYYVRGDFNSPGTIKDKNMRVDTSDNNIELFPIPVGSPAPSDWSTYAGGILAPDGKIYCGNDNNENAILALDTFDPSNNSYYLYVPTDGEFNNLGMLLGCNGYVYTVPFKSSRIQIIHQITPSPNTTAYMVSRFYNKF